MAENKADRHAPSGAPPVAGKKAILGRRYAETLYALADQEGSIDAVLADLRGLRGLWNECSEWRMIATDPRLSRVQINTAVASVIKQGGIGPLTGRFLSLVGHNRRLPELPVMIECFSEEVASRRGEYTADVRSACPLTAAQRDSLLASLGAALGGKINLSVVEDASILGGLTVKIGSRFIDASVKTRLDLLERNLVADAVA